MSDLGQETIVGLMTGTDYVLITIAGEVRRIPASFFFTDSAYQGLAILTTNPSAPARGHWYICSVTGVYTNFGAQQATKNDRFYYNGSTWDLVQFTNLLEEGYRGVVEPTDAVPANLENSHWVKCGSNGTYTNFSNITANSNDFLTYNEPLDAWEKTDGNAGFYTLGQDLDFDGYKGKNVGDGSDEQDSVNYRQLLGKTENWPYANDVSPVGSGTKFTALQCREFVADLYLEGTNDLTNKYCLAYVKRNSGGLWNLSIRKTGSSVVEVANYQVSSSPEDGDKITIHQLTEVNSSGVTGVIAVNWSKIDTGINYGVMHEGYEFDDRIWDKKNALIIQDYEFNNEITQYKEEIETKFLLLNNYPYAKDVNPIGSSTKFTALQCREFVADLYLEGTNDLTNKYCLAYVRRNSGGLWDLSIRKTGSSVVEVANYQVSSSPEDGDKITIHQLTEVNSSGVTGVIAVNWSKIDTGINYGVMHEGYEFDDRIWDKKNALIIQDYELINQFISLDSQKYISWILSETYMLDSIIYDKDYYISSANLTFPDASTGVLDNAVISADGITSIDYTINQIKYTMTINYNSDGTVNETILTI